MSGEESMSSLTMTPEHILTEQWCRPTKTDTAVCIGNMKAVIRQNGSRIRTKGCENKAEAATGKTSA